MTITYDPTHLLYLDEADTRIETARIFDVCLGCRACTDLCEVFPTMIEVVVNLGRPDAGHFTPSEQDLVIDLCHHCGQCAVGCPFVPGLSEQAVEFPRMVRRQIAMRAANGQIGIRRRFRMWMAARRSDSH